jgi:hypothetical protein
MAGPANGTSAPVSARRILGDVVLTQDDIVAKREFPDGCVPSTWSIDLYYPQEEYAKKFPDNPFISIAVHDRRARPPGRSYLRLSRALTLLLLQGRGQRGTT